MSFEETLRLMMREELKSFLRTELLPLLADARCAKQEEDGYLAIQRAAEFADVHPDTIERGIQAEKRTGVPAGELTVKAYGERWLEGRPAQGVASVDDESARLRLHAWPLIGHVPLKELRPHQVRDMVRALRVKISSRRTTLAPRTVRHAYGTLHTILRQAGGRGRLPPNPCVLKRWDLPGDLANAPCRRQR